MKVRVTVTFIKEREMDLASDYGEEPVSFETAKQIDIDGILDDPFAFIDDPAIQASVIIEPLDNET